MSAEQLNGVAGETDEARRARKELQTQLSVLKSGAEICERFAGFGMLGKTIKPKWGFEKVVISDDFEQILMTIL